MGRKPKEFKYLKNTDGRRNNGRKKGDVIIKKENATPAALNKAKKNRSKLYAQNAMAETFGSEEAAWVHLAEMAKDSFPHLKLLFEYKYGKAGDNLDAGTAKKMNINIKNLFTGNQEETDNVIDVTPEDNE